HHRAARKDHVRPRRVLWRVDARGAEQKASQSLRCRGNAHQDRQANTQRYRSAGIHGGQDEHFLRYWRVQPYHRPSARGTAKDALRPAATEKIVVFFDPDKAKPALKSVEDMKFPIAAKAFLRGHRPLPTTTNELLDRLNFQLQQIQFNQLRLGAGGP